MKRHVVILATALCLCTVPFPAQAHHAYGLFFDLCTSVAIEGQVDNVQWKDPHVWIALTMADGTAYRAEWTSLRGLTNRGITTDALKAGDRVVVTGSPPKDPASIRDPAVRALMPDPAIKVVSALSEIRRARDGWSWRLDPESKPECGRK